MISIIYRHFPLSNPVGYVTQSHATSHDPMSRHATLQHVTSRQAMPIHATSRQYIVRLCNILSLFLQHLQLHFAAARRLRVSSLGAGHWLANCHLFHDHGSFLHAQSLLQVSLMFFVTFLFLIQFLELQVSFLFSLLPILTGSSTATLPPPHRLIRNTSTHPHW